jgi:L-threonylcarbamoyladenylate synthase
MTWASVAELIAGAKSGHYGVSFPTDTVPALAAKPDHAELIFATKQRSPDKPLILMGATPEQLWPFVAGTEELWRIWQQVTATYWPGALTLVLPASQLVPVQMNPLDPSTIGLRVPRSAIAQQILHQTGPLATTSANLSGQPALQTLEAIAAQFPGVLTLHPSAVSELAAHPPSLGQPSTVAQWTGSGWQILRQGAVFLKSC